MNQSNVLNATQLQYVPPPPGALWGWPGCVYPEPLPPPGPYAVAAKIIWYVAPMLHLGLGTFGNLITALVICRGYRRISSTAVFLLALALIDTTFLYSTSLRNWVMFAFGVDIRGFSDAGCKIAIYMTYASYQTSSWLLVALTIERVLCIALPHKVKVYCTPRNATIVVVIVCASVYGMNSHLLYGFGNKPLPEYPGLEKCQVDRQDYFVFFEFYWHWIHFTLGYMAPCICIVVGNSFIIHGLRKLQRQKQWIVNEKHNRHSQQATRFSKQRINLTVMLVSLNVIFFISQTPLSILLIADPYIVREVNKFACTDFSEYMTRAEKLTLGWAVAHALGYLNASINFVLYVISGSRFRAEVRALLTCRSRGKARAVFTSARNRSTYTSEDL